MTRSRTRIARLALGTALAAGLLAGCAGPSGRQGLSASSSAAQSALAKGKIDKAIGFAEQAVLAAPRDAAARAMLGQVYLKAGRFASAAQAFDDALELGDEGAATVLGLALAEVSVGDNPSAVELLNDWRDVIPASDLGLALALAGETRRGVAVLADSLRAGDNVVKTRQNLAFAYALDGRWREARLMMSQDVPADQIDQRISQWAMLGKPEDTQARVAHLLGVPIRADQGQPQALALANFPGVEQLALEAQAQAAPVEVAAAPVEMVPEAELAVAEARAPELASAITLASLALPMADTASDAPLLTAFAIVQPVAATPEPARPAPKFRTRVVGSYVPHGEAAAQPGKRKARAAVSLAAPGFSGPVVAGGSHWLQLGSYTDPVVAGEAWRKFVSRTPALKPYRVTVTTAVVDGKQHWRVAAAGFPEYGAAAKMCGAVKQRGGECLVVTAKRESTRMARR